MKRLSGRGITDRRLAVERRNQKMDMIGHQDGSDHIPFRQTGDGSFEGGEGRVIGKHLLAVGHAEREEIDNGLVWIEPNGDTRGVALLGAMLSDQKLSGKRGACPEGGSSGSELAARCQFPRNYR